LAPAGVLGAGGRPHVSPLAGRPSEGARRGSLPHKPVPRLQSESPSLDVAGAPDDLFFSASAVLSAKNGFRGKEVGARVLRAPPARSFARARRKLFAPVRSCGTPWTSADNARAFTQSLLATAWLAGAVSPPNLFHPWRRGHRRTRLRCRHPKRPRTRQRRPASQSCGSSSRLGYQRPSRSRQLPRFIRVTTASCGTHPQRQRTDNNLRQSQSFHAHATARLRKPSR
jgi:hypothetical protein